MPIIAGPDFRDAAIVPVPWRSPETVTVAKLRVAFYTSNGVPRQPLKPRRQSIELRALCSGGLRKPAQKDFSHTRSVSARQYDLVAGRFEDYWESRRAA